MRTWSAIALIVLAAAAFALAPRAHAELGKSALPSPVIFPQQTIPLAFSHTDHLQRDKLSCDYCHEDAPGSTSAADNLIPREEACTTCHEIDRAQPDKKVDQGKAPATCVTCHPGWHGMDVSAQPPRVVAPAPNLKFNHKIHADRKVRCQTCHGDLVKQGVQLATRAQLPRMETCLQCHDGKTAPDACTTCHVSDLGGLVKTSYSEGDLVPSGVLRGDAHDLSWRTNHKAVAQADQKYCANCHKKDYCTQCHNGNEKPMDFHGNDYVNMHAVDARRNTPDCGSCHRRETFCTGCHARTGVSPDPKTSDFDAHSTFVRDPTKDHLFHPKGWYTENAAGATVTGGHHGFDAQRNIRQCASCHREEFCIDCHGAGGDSAVGIGFNPHPVDWSQSKKCGALRAKAGRMCLKCHLTLEETQCG